MSNESATNTTANQIIGLKSQVSRQVGLKNWTSKCDTYSRNSLMDSWRAMYLNGVPFSLIESMVFEYVKNAPFTIWWKGDSQLLGIKTTISDYTNKRGVTSKVHYTHCGTYFGSCKKLGNEPIFYVGNFRLDTENVEEHFAVVENKFKGDFQYDMAWLFEPK